MPIPLIRTNYDFDYQFLVDLDGGIDDLTGATLTASVKDRTKRLKIIADTPATLVGLGTTGVVRIQFPAAVTAGILGFLGLSTSPLFQGNVIKPEEVYIELAKNVGGQKLPIADCLAHAEYGMSLS